jgi:transcriptional regulator with XRE-family HTH domain
VSIQITDSKLFKRLKDKKYRDRFVAGEVKRHIPFQLRALRTARNLTQVQLGAEAEMPQTVISRIENGSASELSIKTLLKLAAALDVALVVRFEPIDRLIDWVDNLSPETVSPKDSKALLNEMETEASKAKQQQQRAPNKDSDLTKMADLALGQRKQKADETAQLFSPTKAIGG